MNLLLRYAREMLPRPIVKGKGEGEEAWEVDKDVKLLLASVQPLFQSRNPAVCGPPYSPEKVLVIRTLGGDGGDKGILLCRNAIRPAQGRTPTTSLAEHLKRGRESGSCLYSSDLPHCTGTYI
jgi:hypothetical protein